MISGSRTTRTQGQREGGWPHQWSCGGDAAWEVGKRHIIIAVGLFVDHSDVIGHGVVLSKSGARLPFVALKRPG